MSVLRDGLSAQTGCGVERALSPSLAPMTDRLRHQPAHSAYAVIVTGLIFLLPVLTLNTKIGVGVIEVAVLIGILLSVNVLLREPRALLWPTRYIMGAFAFNLLVAVVSSLRTDFAWSFLDNPIKQVIAILIIVLIVRTKPKADWLWYGLFIGAISTGIVAIYQRFVLHLLRAEGVHMPIMFGDIAMAMALMSLASTQRFNHTRWAAVPYLAFLGGLTGSLLSGSRGGWIALVLCFIPLYNYGKKAMGRKALLIAVTGISLLVAACFIPKLGVQQRFAEAANDIRLYRSGDPVTSVGARFEMWKGALQLFAEHPVSGVGRANFNQGLNDLIDRGKLSPTVSDFHHAHNEMFHALATQGIFGGLALLLLYLTPLMFFSRQLRVDGNHQPFALAGLLLGLSFVDFGLTQVLFAHHVGSAFYALMTGVLAGLCVMIRRDEEDVARLHSVPANLTPAVSH